MPTLRTLSFKNWFSATVFVGFATMLFAGVTATLVPVAQAASPTCHDINGQSTQVLVNGVPNSGIVYFETFVPAYALEGCVEDTGTPVGDGPFEVKGWAWDDNLGWISLYCGDENADGPPYENLGQPCGNEIYGVTMEGLAGTNPGRLHGYAWGDNTGWISFNCENTGCGTSNYYVEVETTDTDCLGEIFGATPPAGCAPRPSESVYAWSDSVKWIDMTGVVFPWEDLTGIGVNVELEIVTNLGDADETDLLSVDKLTAPVADGSDSYQLILHMTRASDGSTLTPAEAADYNVSLDFLWVDSVDTNQTDSTNGDHSAGNTGAVTKVFSDADFGAYGAQVADGFVAEVTSIAPTTSMNGYDQGNDGSVDASYQNFVLGGPGFNIPRNDLALRGLAVSVEHTPTGICAFGAGVGCARVPVVGSYSGQDWHFTPAVEVDLFDDSINGATISARHLVANSIDYNVACRGTLSGCPGTIATQAGVDSPFEFVYDSGNDGADCTDVNQFDLYSVLSSPLQLTPVFEDDPGGGCLEGIAQSEGENAYVYTTVAYTNGSPISYFSNKLPRVEGTLVVNPVADISGNVYSTGVTNPQTGQEVRSLGDVSTNVLRDTISRNVEAIVAGVEDPGVGSEARIYGWIGGTGLDVTNNHVPLLPGLTDDIPRVYYFTDNLRIGGPLNWTGERTLIIKGGDLFIDDDIYYPSGPGQNHKLGIIVLEDLTTGEGGNVYIHPDVTNIKANIFADGSVFSYSGAPGDINADGEPVFADESQRFNLLKNQLYIQGSLASQNTIGGAVRTVPILGDGTVVSAGEGQYGATPSGRSQARLYDLNFLRYYGLVFERDASGNAIDQQGDAPGSPNYLELAYEGDGGDLVLISGGNPAADLDPNEDFSAVYVEFDPPSLGLPGFSVTGGVDIRLRP